MSGYWLVQTEHELISHEKRSQNGSCFTLLKFTLINIKMLLIHVSQTFGLSCLLHSLSKYVALQILTVAMVTD